MHIIFTYKCPSAFYNLQFCDNSQKIQKVTTVKGFQIAEKYLKVNFHDWIS